MVRMVRKEKGKDFIVNLDVDTHRALKIKAIDEETSMNMIINKLVKTYLGEKNGTNKGKTKGKA